MIKEYIQETIKLTNSAIDKFLPNETVEPKRLHKAMRYSALAPGKRIRPALIRAATIACGAKEESAIPAMVAVELLHCYTLIHDDLPAMDDDDLRRGLPTCHKKFDEPTAILAGDALQSYSFFVLAECGAEAVKKFANAIGSTGVVGGQQDDLDAENKQFSNNDEKKTLLDRIHRRKTAALIRISCELGGIVSNATNEQKEALSTFGESIGLAFQVIDDILDETATVEKLGKTPGKDANSGKLTFVACYGMEEAKAEARRLKEDAEKALSIFGEEANTLRELGKFIVDRDY